MRLGGQVVHRAAVPEVHVIDHAELLERVERAVDGRAVDVGMIDLHRGREIVRALVRMFSSERDDHGSPHGRDPHTLLTEFRHDRVSVHEMRSVRPRPQLSSRARIYVDGNRLRRREPVQQPAGHRAEADVVSALGCRRSRGRDPLGSGAVTAVVGRGERTRVIPIRSEARSFDRDRLLTELVQQLSTAALALGVAWASPIGPLRPKELKILPDGPDRTRIAGIPRCQPPMKVWAAVPQELIVQLAGLKGVHQCGGDLRHLVQICLPRRLIEVMQLGHATVAGKEGRAYEMLVWVQANPAGLEAGDRVGIITPLGRCVLFADDAGPHNHDPFHARRGYRLPDL